MGERQLRDLREAGEVGEAGAAYDGDLEGPCCGGDGLAVCVYRVGVGVGWDCFAVLKSWVGCGMEEDGWWEVLVGLKKRGGRWVTVEGFWEGFHLAEAEGRD